MFFGLYIGLLYFFFWLISTLTLFLIRLSFVGFEWLLGCEFMQDFKGITTLKSCFWFFYWFFLKKHFTNAFFYFVGLWTLISIISNCCASFLWVLVMFLFDIFFLDILFFQSYFYKIFDHKNSQIIKIKIKIYII